MAGGRPPGATNRLNKQTLQDRTSELTHQYEELKAARVVDQIKIDRILYQLGKMEGLLVMGRNEVPDDDDDQTLTVVLGPSEARLADCWRRARNLGRRFVSILSR